MSALNIVVLLSGNGSTLQAIIDSIAEKKLFANIQAVFSDKPNAFGLTRAKNHDIPTHIVEYHKTLSREAYDTKLAAAIKPYQPSLIILAGFMRILSAPFVKQFERKILNIHPSLLPDYPGLHTHESVLAAHEPYHGTTIHFVDETLDGGPILAQGKLVVRPEDTVESLKARVQKMEHRLYPKVIQWFSEQRTPVANQQIFYFDEE